MGGISDYFSDENSFFDRYILNAPILSASYFNVTRDELVSCLTTGKAFQADPPEGFTEYAESFCPGIRAQGEQTREQLLKAAALVGNKETQIQFLRHFSLEGMRKLYESGHNEYYLVYDMLTPKVTCFVLTQLVLMKDLNTGDLVASFMTKDISRLKHFRKVATMAVNSICDCIAVIDTMDGSVTFETVSAQLMRVMPELVSEKKLDYDKTFVGIINAMARPGENAPLSDAISTDTIIKELSEKDEYITVFDLETKPGEVSRKQVMFQWFDNSHRYIAALQSDISTTYHEEMNQLDKLNRDLNIKLGRDQVTGLPNKNSSEIQIGDRFDPRNSVLFLFDLTNLIYINDTVGRDVGNMLLYQFAHIISAALPAGTFIGRYTGAEIITLCNGIRHSDAEEYLGRIESKIARYNEENPDCEIEYVNSVIFASSFEDCTFPKLYSEAFRLLNEAKNKKGIPAAAEGDLSYQLQEMSSKSKELEYTSRHDGLTGLLNKTAGLDEIADRTLYPPHRYHVMFVMDIDNYKYINDTFGHEFGDDILKKLGAIIRRQFRPGDVLVRYGGDEFIAFMTNVSGPAQIEDKAWSIIEAVDNMLCESGCRKTGFDQSNSRSDLTGISIGIVWTDKSADASKMFAQADSALYDAKRAGKNRFEITRNMGFND